MNVGDKVKLAKYVKAVWLDRPRQYETATIVYTEDRGYYRAIRLDRHLLDGEVDAELMYFDCELEVIKSNG